MPLLELDDLRKAYGNAPVFEHVRLTLAPGELVAILGDSGVGKSTLLNCMAALDRPDGGQLRYDGRDVLALRESEQAHWRRRHVGFVFQAFHVLPHLNVAQNVGLPLQLLGQPDGSRVDAMLEAVGLGGLGPRMPRTLSGGQLQRVAIARALVHRPGLVLADEPTGNLDPQTAERILDLLVGQLRAHGASAVLVTHAQHAAARADRVLRLTPQGLVTHVTV